MKNFLFTCLLLSLARPVWAEPLGDRIHLGVSGGYGFGRLTDTSGTNSSESFNTIALMAHAGARFTPALLARISFGVDDCLDLANTDNSGVASFYDDGLLIAADIDLLWFPFKGNLTLLDPYVLSGIGYPRLIHAGAGTDVSLGGFFALFGEMLYGTAFEDHHGLFRIGVKFRI